MLVVKLADDNHRVFSSGGVVLASRDGKIVCENTIDARLDVVFRKKLPQVYKTLLFCCLVLDTHSTFSTTRLFLYL